MKTHIKKVSIFFRSIGEGLLYMATVILSPNELAKFEKRLETARERRRSQNVAAAKSASQVESAP